MDSKGKEDYSWRKKITLRLKNESKTLKAIGKIGRTHSTIQRVVNNYKLLKSVISKIRNDQPSQLTFC